MVQSAGVRAASWLLAHRGPLALGLVIAAALWVRWTRTPFGLPYLHHWDEPIIGSKALELLKSGTLNPKEFWYGSLLTYANLVLDAVHFLHLAQLPVGADEAVARLAEIRTGADTGWTWTLSHPSFFLVNRRLTALLGAASVASIAHLAWRLGGLRVALLAAAGLAFARTHVQHSAYVTADVPSLCCFLLTASLSLEFARRARLSWLFAAAAVAGAGASIKYNAGVAWLIPALTLAFCWRALEHRQRGRAVALLFGAPVAAFLAGTPYALLDWPQFLDHMAFNLRTYKVLGHDYSLSEAGWPNFRLQLEQMAQHTPLWLILLAPIGLLVLARRRQSWPLLLGSALYLVAMSRMRIAFHRNFLLLYPLVALGAAVAIDGLARWLTSGEEDAEKQSAWRRRLAAGVIGIAALGLTYQAVAVGRASHAVGHRIETRRDFAKRLAPLATERGWRRIGWASELRMHPIDLRRTGTENVELPLQALLCAAPSLDAVILPTDTWSGGEIPALEARSAALDERLNGLRAALRIEGSATSLNTYSANPGIQALAGSTVELRGRCGRIDLTLRDSDEAQARPNAGFALPDDATAGHEPVWLPAGRYEIVWKMAPASRPHAELEVRLAAALVQRDGGGRSERLPLGERREVLKPYEVRRSLEVVLPHDGALSVRWTTGALAPGSAAGSVDHEPAVVIEGIHVRPI